MAGIADPVRSERRARKDRLSARTLSQLGSPAGGRHSGPGPRGRQAGRGPAARGPGRRSRQRSAAAGPRGFPHRDGTPRRGRRGPRCCFRPDAPRHRSAADPHQGRAARVPGTPGRTAAPGHRRAPGDCEVRYRLAARLIRARGRNDALPAFFLHWTRDSTNPRSHYV